MEVHTRLQPSQPAVSDPLASLGCHFETHQVHEAALAQHDDAPSQALTQCSPANAASPSSATHGAAPLSHVGLSTHLEHREREPIATISGPQASLHPTSYAHTTAPLSPAGPTTQQASQDQESSQDCASTQEHGERHEDPQMPASTPKCLNPRLSTCSMPSVRQQPPQEWLCPISWELMLFPCTLVQTNQVRLGVIPCLSSHVKCVPTQDNSGRNNQ